MKNIERIRAMDAEQLAGFLAENGAPVPTEFCDIVCTGEDCEKCGFLGVAGDKGAWKLWLEKDDGEPGPPDYKELYKKLELRVYGPPNFVPPGPDADLIKRIEKALGFRLFLWQKTLILHGSFRQLGSTTATCVRKLIRIKDSGVIKLAVPRNALEHFEQRELMRVKTLLDKESIKTNRIQLDFKVSKDCCYWVKEKPCDDWAREHNSKPYLGLMAVEGGQREEALVEHGCNYYGKNAVRSCPFAIFLRDDVLRLAQEMDEWYHSHLDMFEKIL